MSEIEKHLSKVVLVAERISKFVSNTTKTGKEKRTEAFLVARIQLLETYWLNYQEQNDKICEIATPDEIKGRQYFTSDVFSDVECAYTEALGWLKNELNQLQALPNSKQSYESTTLTRSQSSVKLPKISLPTFSGSYIEWPAYRDTYVSLIHDNTTLSDIQKMHYLKSSITGAASKLLQHLVITSSNYTAAWNILTSRFENIRLLVNSNLHMIMSIPSMTSESAREIRRILDNFTQSVRALENLQRPVNQWDDWLVYLLSSKLDQSTRKDWETSISSSTSVPILKSLTDFLEGRIHTLEAINDSGGIDKKNRVYSHRGKVTTHSYHTSSAKTCPLCKGKHILMFCNVFRAKSVDERMLIVENSGLCSNCLKADHATQQCSSNSRCKICNCNHHTMLHRENRTASQQQTTNTHNSFTTSPYLASNCAALSSANRLSTVLLATAIVIVQASNGRTVRARALLDQGSESSFISSSLAKLLRLDRHKVHIPIYGVGSTQAGIAESQVSYTITSTVNEQYVFHMQSFVLPKLAQFIPSGKVNIGYWPHVAGLELADPQFSVSASIDLILGADIYSRILLNEVIHGPPGTPTAQRTALGWILSGPTSNSSPESIVCLHCSQEENLNYLLRKFWELEEINTKLPLTPEEEECEKFFRSTHSRDDTGRFIVHLPLKSTSKQLGDSHQYALASMLRIERSLKQNPLLKSMYISFMDEYIKLGHMVPVTSDDEPASKYHLPHHAVLKPTSATTKLRVVFNASCQTTTGVSLNDILHIGPKVQNDVSSIILKWRQYPIVFSTDIEKMYRQILVHPPDTNLQRILWRKNPSEPIQCYRLCTVTYGTSSAPYLACRTLLQLAEDHKAQLPLGAAIVRNNFYVDDGLFGAFNSTSALQARDEIRSLMDLGGFRLRKWLTNRPELLEDISDEDKDLPSMPRFVTDEEFKALGIYWFPLQDTFKFHVSLPEHKTITKRTVLSDISRLYDPLGWITPITINAKILMQKLWLAGCTWDEELPPELMETWIKYKASLQSLKSLCVNRWIGITGTQSAFELHGFCDASMAAYSAAVYIRILHDTDNIQVTLLTAKASSPRAGRIKILRIRYMDNILRVNSTTIELTDDTFEIFQFLPHAKI